MTDYGTQISTRDDFKGVKIYERQEQEKPIYTIAFQNPELKESLFRLILFFLILLPSFFLPVLIMEYVSKTWWALAAPVVLNVVTFLWLLKNPKWVNRAIELNAGNDEINVLKNGSVETRHKYSRLHDLVIDEHPKGAKARVTREEIGGRVVSGIEKVHSLFGLFGVSGTEKVVLVSRFEWPRHDTLFEVQQAMQWTNNRIHNLVERETDKPVSSGSETPAGPAVTGIKPPLD